jgi:hypothetical protein
MAAHALFAGLVVDEYEQPVTTSQVGDEAFYVVNDNGFLRHVASEDVDRQVLKEMGNLIEGSEDVLSEQAAKMLGQDDIFTRAMILKQLENVDEQLDKVLQTGLPENSRAYLGMSGFRIQINLHGEVLDIQQPGAIDPNEE